MVCRRRTRPEEIHGSTAYRADRSLLLINQYSWCCTRYQSFVFLFLFVRLTNELRGALLSPIGSTASTWIILGRFVTRFKSTCSSAREKIRRHDVPRSSRDGCAAAPPSRPPPASMPQPSTQAMACLFGYGVLGTYPHS